MPDLYQGTEFWDFSLVDPDNRRPVDFAARASALGDGDSDIHALAGTWRDGRIKQALIARVLALRRRKPDLFAEGSYLPVQVQGDRAGSVIAFARRHGEQWLLAAMPRLPLALLQDEDGIGIAPETWRGTTLHLESAPARPVIDVLTGAPVGSLDGPVPLARLCTTLPFVLLTMQG